LVIQTPFYSIAFNIKLAVDTIAFPVQSVGSVIKSMRFQSIGFMVQSAVDAVTFGIQSVIDVVAHPVHLPIDFMGSVKRVALR
jgi:hypothetical protein